MPFEFATAARIVFGTGRIQELPGIAQGFGRHAFVVTGANPQRVQPQLSLLSERGVAITPFSIRGEPAIADVVRGAELACAAGCDLVIGLGGGSALDAAKAIAALARSRGDIFDYLEVIGRGQPLNEMPLPIVAVPTTAGTGAEVTRNAVLHSPEHQVKVSLRSPFLLPRVALIDPDLTLDLPPALTAHTGMDALTQLIEPWVSKRANPITDALCSEGIPRVARSLRKAVTQGRDSDARHDMALASLFGGLALANAGLGAVHGFAAPIGGMFNAPHGAICAALLPDVMAANISRARETSATEVLQRYEKIARWLVGSPDLPSSVEWVRQLARDLGIPRLSEFGIERAHLPAIAEKAAVSSSMKGNPAELSAAQLVAILERAL